MGRTFLFHSVSVYKISTHASEWGCKSRHYPHSFSVSPHVNCTLHLTTEEAVTMTVEYLGAGFYLSQEQHTLNFCLTQTQTHLSRAQGHDGVWTVEMAWLLILLPPLPYFTGIVIFLNPSLQLLHNNVNSHLIGLSHFVKSIWMRPGILSPWKLVEHRFLGLHPHTYRIRTWRNWLPRMCVSARLPYCS